MFMQKMILLHTQILIIYLLICASTSVAFISQAICRIHVSSRTETKKLNIVKLHSDFYDNDTQVQSTRKSFFTKALVKTASIGASAAIALSEPLPATATSTKLSNDLQSLRKKSTSTDDVISTLQSTNHFAPYTNGGTAIVTGGNSGIGFETVLALTKAGMNVIMCSRRIEAGIEAKNILPTNLQDKVAIQQLDLADMSSVQRATTEIFNHPFIKQRKIDVIVNNAGVIDKKGTPVLSAQGLELQFAINHVGHHMFTRLLLPSLNQNGRIVTVASDAHRFANNVDTVLAGKGGYSGSKLCNILFAEALQDRLNSIGREDIKSVSLMPGVIATPLFNGSSGLWTLTPSFADRTVEQGAATTVLCALVDNGSITGGKYYKNCQVLIPSGLAVDTGGQIRDKLWLDTENLISKNGFLLPDRLTM